MTSKVKTLVYAFLRIVCGAIIMMYGIFRVGIPLVSKEPIYMDKNDGYVLLGSICLLLCVEAVKAATEAYVKRKSNHLN